MNMKKYIGLFLISLMSVGSGISQCFPDRHSTNWFDQWISCTEKESPNPNRDKGHWLMFDLKRAYEIQQIKFWNLNDPDQLNSGIEMLAVDYSEDSTQWEHAGDFILGKATGNNRYEGMDWIDVDIPKARYILLYALSNFGGSCAGIAEVRFAGEKIKTPVETDDQNNKAYTLKLEVIPNPFEDLVRINFNTDMPGMVQFEIHDVLGRVILKDNVNVLHKFSTVKLSSRKWLPGNYFLKASNGKHHAQTQLVKIN